MLLRWHHELFCLFWKHNSKVRSRKPRISPEAIRLIKEMAANNRLWGAERIRGELLKLGIRDNDRKFGQHFARVAATSSIKILRTLYRTPQANAVCERFLGSVRRACLDHFLILREKQLARVLRAYGIYFNQARPHQGMQQRIPDPQASSTPFSGQSSKICAVPVLGGLHHDYRRVA
jgi:transposase InsO family protein